MTARLDQPADLLDGVGRRFDTASVPSAHQKTSDVESVFELTYDIAGAPRPARVADVTVLDP